MIVWQKNKKAGYRQPGKGDRMKVLLADFHKCVKYSGGIERVLSNMAAALHERGHEVTVVFADEKEGAPFFPLPEGVRYCNLFHIKSLGTVKQDFLIKALREILRPISREAARDQNYRLLRKAKKHCEAVLKWEQPDVVISFREPTTRLLIAGADAYMPVISMLHNDPDEIFRGMPEEEKKSLMESAFVQVLLPSFKKKAEGLLHFEQKPYDKDRIVVIPNAVAPAKFETDPGAARKIHTITCVGRLTGRTKRQHLLVEAFAKLAAGFPDWQVELWGDTYDKAYVAKLKGEIKKAGLGDRILIKGVTKDMESVWKKTDIFAFPSHHEGFGLGLAEAMSYGIPAVGYRNCPAVNELIEDGKTGFLVDDGTEPLKEALEMLMRDPELRSSYGKAGKAAMEAYRPDVVWDAWDALIQKAAPMKRKAKPEDVFDPFKLG